MQRFSEQERFANSILELASSFEIIDGGCSGDDGGDGGDCDSGDGGGDDSGDGSGDGGGDDGGGGGAAGRILITDVALSK